MTYLKIGETLYPASLRGRVTDRDWDNRESMFITLLMTHGRAVATFVDGLEWSYIDVANGEETEYDMSEFEVAGSITDNRDGTVTAKMGKFTDADALSVLTGEV